MSVSRGEVMKAAAEFEKQGHDYYMEMAARTQNRLARQMFESLARDELDHIEWIQARVSARERAAEARRALYDSLRRVFDDAPDQAADLDVQALDRAIEIEAQSIEAYRQWAEGAEDADVRETCLVLADYEKLHRELLENMKLYLEQPANWFMQEERWNFEAG